MKNAKTANKQTKSNNVVVTYRANGKEFCGRYKSIENAMKCINSSKWNSPKRLGWEVVKIEDKSE